MFLETAIKNNPALLDAAFFFHKHHLIEPNTYCIDLDMVRMNSALIAQEAQAQGISLYFMSKQFGRNPLVARAVSEMGLPQAVAVDMDEARVLHDVGIKIGHLGHLVQIPQSSIEEALMMNPEVITCFGVEKARQINKAAQKLGKIQDILLRVIDEKSCLYPGQEGGICLRNLEETAKEILSLGNVRIVGITSFPCFLYDDESESIKPTRNMEVLIDARDVLTQMGIEVKQINAPSATCVSSIPLLKECGATHGEPGHALTGTTPLHALGNEPEKIAMVYATEVSHRDDHNAYVFGGGFYPRSHLKHAYNPEHKHIFQAQELPAGNIDYYGRVEDEDGLLNIGDGVLFAFRTQVFFTRSKVAVIEGIQKGKPALVGIYDSTGRQLK